MCHHHVVKNINISQQAKETFLWGFMRFYHILMSNIFICETKMLVLFKIQLNEKKMNAMIYFLVTSALFEMKTTGYVKTATQFDNIF